MSQCCSLSILLLYALAQRIQVLHAFKSLLESISKQEDLQISRAAGKSVVVDFFSQNRGQRLHAGTKKSDAIFAKKEEKALGHKQFITPFPSF